MVSKNTIAVRIPIEVKKELERLCIERFDNRAFTKEKTVPTPGKLIKLALRQPNLKLALTKLPATEDLR